MTPEQSQLYAEWQKALQERIVQGKLFNDLVAAENRAKQAYAESIAEFKVGDIVKDRYGKLFVIKHINLFYSNDVRYNGKPLKKDFSESKFIITWISGTPLTKVENES